MRHREFIKTATDSFTCSSTCIIITYHVNTYTAYTPQSFVCKKQIINENYLIIIKLLDFLKCYAHIYIYFI